MNHVSRPTPTWRRYLRFRGADVRGDVDDEIAFHLALDAEELVARGEPADRAMREARALFGDVERARQQCYRIGNRRRRRDERSEAFTALGQDVRYAMRSLRGSPAHALGVILTMGLAITALSATFAVIDPLFVRQPSYLESPGTVNRIYENTNGELAQAGATRFVSFERYSDLRQLTHAFAEMAATSEHDAVVSIDGRAQLQDLVAASASMWRMFDARPVVGRFPTDGDDGGGTRSLVVVLGYEFWHEHFKNDPDVVGATLTIAGLPHRIIGVAPRGFAALSFKSPSLFVPLGPLPVERSMSQPPSLIERYNSRWLEVIARRRRGWSDDEATADLNAAMRASADKEDQLHFTMQGLRAQRAATGLLAPLLREHGPQPSDEARVALWLGILSTVVLLVSALNVANLMLARTLRRRRELAVRLALGATVSRVMRLLFVEAAVLMSIGAALGLSTLAFTGNVLREKVLPHVNLAPIDVTGRVVGFSVLMAALAAVGVAGIPALHARGWNVRSAIQGAEHGPAPHRSRLRSFILVTQAALSVVLCVAAGLFVHSLYNIHTLPLGYDPRHVVVVAAVGGATKRESVDTIAMRVAERLRTAGKATNVATSMTLPFSMSMRRNFTAPGADAARVANSSAFFDAVSPEYFDVIGTRIVAGRAFDRGDTLGAERVAVISEPLADYLWPGKSPIGECLTIAQADGCTRIVGVTEASRMWSYQRDAMQQIYTSSAQTSGPLPQSVLLRTRGDAALAVAGVQAELRGVAPPGVLLRVTSMQDALDLRATSWRVGAGILSAFAMLTLMVASIGMYAATNFDVAEREREIGIRVALGARHRDLVAGAAWNGLRLATAGALVGSLVALAIGSVLSSLLFHVSSRDPGTYVGAALLTIGTSLVAAIVPATRTIRADPAAILRSG